MKLSIRPQYLHKYLLLPLVLSAPFAAQAQAPAQAPERAHDHTHESDERDERGGESNVDWLWRKSDEAFHKGDYPRAIGLHRAIVALDPGDVQSWSVAAWLMWSLGNKSEAVAWIDKGIKANPQNWEMLSEAGQHFDLQKIPGRALESYQGAAALLTPESDKQDAQLLRRRLAHAAQRADKLELSAQTWRDLVRDYPNEVVNKNNLARVEALARGEQK